MPNYTKLDDDKFEVTVPSTEQLSVQALKEMRASHEARIAVIDGHLKAAADIGMASAAAAVAANADVTP